MADPDPNSSQQTQQQASEPALQPARYCSKCAKVPDSLLTCGQCRVVFYCDRNCQRADWNLHKQFCSTWAEQKGRITRRGPPVSLTEEWASHHTYWHVTASQDAAAQQVAAAIGVKLVSQCPGQSCRSIDATLSHLICTGKDTEQNLALFFGEEQVPHILKATLYSDLQYTVFSRARAGSYAFHAVQTWDRDISQLSWTPRPALEDKFGNRLLLQDAYQLNILRYVIFEYGEPKMTQRDLPRLFRILRGMMRDPKWPFGMDDLSAIDSVRAALQALPNYNISIDLEAIGLGIWHIPDEIAVLMHEEDIGLREAAIRVLGEGCGHHCTRCNSDYPVPYSGNNRCFYSPR